MVKQDNLKYIKEQNYIDWGYLVYNNFGYYNKKNFRNYMDNNNLIYLYMDFDYICLYYYLYYLYQLYYIICDIIICVKVLVLLVLLLSVIVVLLLFVLLSEKSTMLSYALLPRFQNKELNLKYQE